MQNKCVFLDRDGVINEEIGDYILKVEDFKISKGIIEILRELKKRGYLLIVITNQAGIAKGLYTREDVEKCHEYFERESGNLIDEYYYSPYHPVATESLGRKPGSLLFEKAIAKYKIDPLKSWMIGDKERDLIPAKKLGMKTVRIIDSYAIPGEVRIGDHQITDFDTLLEIIK
jgi:D-glycero-D-manno-heptose 1,7-bisphosphate phosphatase